MAEIVNLETEEVLFESDDPEAITTESDRLSEEWHAANGGGDNFPYAIKGFDSIELETGTPREYEPPKPPPTDSDRIVVNEEEQTITIHGNASVPVDPPEDYRVIEAGG